MRKLDRIDPSILATNPRASIQSWLKYRDIVIAAYKQHPKPFVYRPVSMTPSSVCSKMRDAVRGKLAFDYPEDEVTNNELARWYSEVILKHDKEQVYIGLPEEVRATLIGVTPSGPNANGLKFPTLTFEEISAFTLLLSAGRILGPVEILQPPDITLLPRRPNVEILNRKDGSLVIL